MAPFALVGMAGGLALFWAAPFALARALWPPGRRRVLVLAALWTLADFARAHVLTGFPWGLLGYAWVETPVIQAAALVGPHMLGLPDAGRGAAAGARAPGARLAAAAALVAAGWGFGAWRLAQPVPERAEPLVVRLVQPERRPAAEVAPGMAAGVLRPAAGADPRAGRAAPDVVIWSETAVPFVLGRARRCRPSAAAAAAPGAAGPRHPARRAGAGGDAWFNSLAVLGPDGTPAAVYDKHHLVPFGEYIPLARLARAARPAGARDADAERLHAPGRAAAGRGARPAAVPAADLLRGDLPARAAGPRGPAGVAGAGDQRRLVRRGSGPYQHFAQARVRAIEQGLPLARAANTGISAMVDPFGRVVARLGSGEVGYVDASFRPHCRRRPTPVLRRFTALMRSCSIFGLTV